MSNAAPADLAQGIAIIGMSGRFPGARNLDEFWRNLRDGADSISSFTDQELLAAGVYPEYLADPTYVRANGVLADVEMFDAAFFGFNPREAAALDPQQRVFLECAWESLEHAGCDASTYPGLIGVYAGVSMSSYLATLYAEPELVRNLGEFQITLGNDKDNLPTSVSYKLNLKGPSMAIQTACSTSLVAISVACQSLLSYQCDMALAGAVRIAFPQTAGYFYQDGGILSPDGHCRAFDANARGTVAGNGVGIVVLKRLQEAIADGDCIHAVIKGTAVNNDGSVKVGYTAPSVEGQAQVIAMALAAGEIDPRTVTYVEAHGTGTDLGDPIEVAALTQAFRLGTSDNGFCALGSVKANLGHLDTAAGVAGLIKTVLALQHQQIPASPHFDQPNPKIDFRNSPFYVNTRLAEWKSDGGPRRAGVSSFGIGGTNAHAIVEEAPPLQREASHRPAQLLVLSARTPASLDAMSDNLREHLIAHPEADLADVAYTLQTGRRAFPHRRALVCRNAADAVDALAHADKPRVLSGRHESPPRSVAFMFAGQGTQHPGMALGLYQHEPTFRAELDRAIELLTPHLGFDLRTVLYPAGGDCDQARLRLQQTAAAQPALFAVEYALARLWMEWGVRPRAMIGHSLGEYVAACLAGVFALEDALALVAARGQMMQEMPGGAMLAVPLSEHAVRAYLHGDLSLAALNGPSLCVVSGSIPDVDALERRLSASGLPGRRLQTSHAFHSGMMEPMLASFRARVESVPRHPPQIPFVSNVTGTWITDAEATDPDYWTRHVRETVRFGEGVERLLAEDDLALLEIGPGHTLSGLARQQAGRAGGQVILASLPDPPHAHQDDASHLGTLAKLWLSGVSVDWSAFHSHARRVRTPLPTYPFERRRFWVDAPAADAGDALRASEQKRPDIADWFYIPSWRRTAPSSALGSSAAPNARWLVFADGCGVGAALAHTAAHTGADVVLVTAGPAFGKSAANAYTINPRERRDYEALLRDLRATRGLPHSIVHLWSVTPAPDAGSALAAFDGIQTLGFQSLLFLAQALGDELGPDRLQLVVVSSELQDVTGRERVCASKATLLGPCKVIPEEYPQVICRSVDLDAPPPGTPVAPELIEQLCAEVNAETTDAVVALRGRHRWAQVFEEVRLQSAADATPLRDRGVYLITGGIGGIGLTLAEHLARSCRARLVLVGRSALPERSEQTAWLERHDEGDAVSRKIRQLRAIEEAGAEIVVETADVADLESMRGVVARAKAHFGSINGVIHCAGVAGGRMLQLHTPDDAARVIRPKALGALVLDELLKDDDLDFFLLCSSLNAILGALGQADYCGANAMLDAYAHQASAGDRRRVVSVNWDTWQEVGMAVNTVLPRDMEARRAESLEQGIRSAEGVEAMMRILGRPLTQVAVSTTDLQALLDPGASRDLDASGEERDATQSGFDESLHARPTLGTDYIPPRDEVEQQLAAMWQTLLGVAQVGVDDNFFELGGHSLLAVQFISRLRESLHVELGIRNLFDTPTVSGLAHTIKQRVEIADVEAERVAEALALVEQLSEQEIQALLAESPDWSGSEDRT